MERENQGNWEDFTIYGYDSNAVKDDSSSGVQNPGEADVLGPYDPEYEELQYTENNDN